jgi:hypothetical protein
VAGGLPELRRIIGAGASLRRFEPLDQAANTIHAVRN